LQLENTQRVETSAEDYVVVSSCISRDFGIWTDVVTVSQELSITQTIVKSAVLN